MKITYLEHSGFVVEYAEYVLIFDYYRGKLPKVDPNKHILVFASHIHPDHFNKRIFKWKKDYPDIKYILSDDIKAKKLSEEVIYLGAHQKMELSDTKAETPSGTTDSGFHGEVQVETLRSTDEGVAFLVHLKDKLIYHAGDLNWWHWEGEDPKENEEMGLAYRAEIDRIRGQHIDVAFVPLDPRLENQYYWGLDYYMRQTDTDVVFPMHMWGEDYSVYDRLMREPAAEGYRDRVMRIEKTQQTFEIE